MRVRLLTCDKDAYELASDPGSGMQGVVVSEIHGEAELDAAASAGKLVFTMAEDGGLGRMVYDGESWLTEGKPESVEPETVELALAAEADARAEVMQSEIEALVDALADAVPARRLTALKSSVLGARKAIASNDLMAMAKSAGSLSATPATIAGFGEVDGGTARA